VVEQGEGTIKNIGFIGLGKMGKPMAKRLLGAGFSLNIWNRTKSKAMDLSKQGAKVMDSPKEVAARSDVIITVVFDDVALEAVTFGDDGILAGISASSILIDMSTVSPKLSGKVALALAERGADMLRAPVSGSIDWAEAGKLTILLSGDEQAYGKCRKILEVMGEKIFYVGAEEEARYLKIALNIMSALNGQALAEAVTLCQKAGVDWSRLLEVISNSVVASPWVCAKTSCLKKRDFSPTGTVKLVAKDMDVALNTGKQLGAALPLVSLVRQFLGALDSTGRGELDQIALVLLMEELAGIKH
jgi:3-hydroxyisobutyrate dehydrogenase